MMLTRSQIEKLTREKLIEELLQLSDISIQVKALNNKFDTFASKLEELKFDLLITKNCNTLLHQLIYFIILGGVLKDHVLEETVYRAISLTRHEVTHDDLHACHRLKNKDRVIVKSKDINLKCSIQINRKVKRQKILELSQLKCSGKLFISKSTCYENKQLCFEINQLKISKMIHLTRFWNNAVNVKVIPNAEIHEIFHKTDIEKLLGIGK